MRSAPGDKNVPGPADLQVEFVVLCQPDARDDQELPAASGPLTLFRTEASGHLNSRTIEAGSCYPMNGYLDLLLSVITVSLKTQGNVKGLPKLDFADMVLYARG